MTTPGIRRSLLIPLGLLLGGCSLEPETAWVDVHNHTDSELMARDTDWKEYDGCRHDERGKPVTIPARSARWVVIDVDLYDGDIEITGDHGRRVYDLDFAPYEYREVIHIRDGDIAPAGNG